MSNNITNKQMEIKTKRISKVSSDPKKVKLLNAPKLSIQEKLFNRYASLIEKQPLLQDHLEKLLSKQKNLVKLASQILIDPKSSQYTKRVEMAKRNFVNKQIFDLAVKEKKLIPAAKELKKPIKEQLKALTSNELARYEAIVAELKTQKAKVNLARQIKKVQEEFKRKGQFLNEIQAEQLVKARLIARKPLNVNNILAVTDESVFLFFRTLKDLLSQFNLKFRRLLLTGKGLNSFFMSKEKKLDIKTDIQYWKNKVRAYRLQLKLMRSKKQKVISKNK